jgi:arylsulfatase
MNLVLICTDQQRRDSVGCYGNPAVETPRLDGLASRGLRFDRAYVANPICMPNRMSLFTGCYPRNHGVWTNGIVESCRPPMLSELLATAGFQTCSIGKLHFMPYGGGDRGWESAARWEAGFDPREWSGPYSGFDHVELSIGHTRQLAHYGRWFRSRGGTDHMLVPNPDETRPIPVELHDSTWIGERASRFIRDRDSDEPFFLFASFPDPHHPFDPPESVAAKYRHMDLPSPNGTNADLATRPPHYASHFRGGWHRSGTQPEAHPEGVPEITASIRRANTYAMIELIDRGVGMILDSIEDVGISSETLVVFTSDHGELLGDHGLWYKGPFFYEGLVGVPLIVSGPGVAKGVSDRLFSAVDLMPTLLDLLGVPVPHSVDGLQLSNHLSNPESQTRERCLVEYRNGYGEADCAAVALITRDHKYVRYEDGECELTDLVADPLEHRNVAGDPDYAAIEASLRSQTLLALLSSGARWPEQVSHA